MLPGSVGCCRLLDVPGITGELLHCSWADQNFYFSANLVMNFAARAREIFESSEVEEKRQLLGLVFQNLQLKDATLSVSVQEPFLTMMDFKNRPGEWGRLDGFRTFDWRKLGGRAKIFTSTLMNISMRE